MTPILTESLPQIRLLCEQFGVQRMFVFGNVLQDQNFATDGDIDLLYKRKPEVGQATATNPPDFFQMLSRFEALLNRKVDLIDLTRNTNSYLIQSRKTRWT